MGIGLHSHLKHKDTVDLIFTDVGAGLVCQTRRRCTVVGAKNLSPHKRIHADGPEERCPLEVL